MASVEIYSTQFCGYCMRAKRLLSTKDVAVTDYDVFAEPSRRQEMVARSGGRTSVPQIFINGTHIGGCDELYALERSGRLASMLEATG
ncbi:glutaredoxin 3 [Rhodospirillaceae bacterium SYSU D60014]|uniref:glutaredoxin 3 n=1 Tax=Virgifigura deserti TaxID=2268457 RepID=UPI000E66A87A